MKKIYKYAIEITDDQDIVMPVGAKILTVQNQNGVPCIWAMVDPNSEKENVHIRVHDTGHNVPDSDRLEYIGTFQMCGGSLVFHVFKVL